MNPATDAIRAKTTRRDHLTQLLASLDTLCFIEIAICYYCDNSLFLLCARAFVQVLIVQARAELLATSAPLVPVLTANIISVAFHLLHASPTAASRSAHGYLHGGLIIVFEGQLGPISKSRLVLQDILISAIQLLILCISYERQVLSDTRKETPPQQDLEAEEEGRVGSQRRENEGAEDTGDGIEMQSLLTEAGRAPPPTTDAADDLILTLNVRRSLTGSLDRSETATGEDSSNGPSSVGAMRLRALLTRFAAERTAANT